MFAEEGRGSLALALFRLLPTCLHLQQNKQVLESDLLFFANCPLPLTSQQNCSHSLQLIMNGVVILASNLIFECLGAWGDKGGEFW